MKNSYQIFLLSMLVIVSCTDQPSLSGKVKMDPQGDWAPKVYLIDPVTFDGIARSYVGKILDSATVAVDGRFVFDRMPDAPAPRLLEIAIQKKSESHLNKLDNEAPGSGNYFPIIWKNGDQIEISTTADHFQRDLTVKSPSPENEAMLRARDLRLEGFEKFLSGRSPEIHDESGLLEAEKALLDFQRPLMAFAEESEHLLPALAAIRWISTAGDYERIPEFIVGQCEKWSSKRPDHPWVAQLCQYGDREVLPVLKGDMIPNFLLPMLSGDTLALKQLLGKQLTLLDLWASWCAPCRRENRDHLVPLWEEHHQKGFQIIGYALDAGQKAWVRAIEKDGVYRWPQAAHLRGDDSPFFAALRISTIPANFLLDGTGKVVAKNLHGKELAKFVDDYLADNQVSGG